MKNFSVKSSILATVLVSTVALSLIGCNKSNSADTATPASNATATVTASNTSSTAGSKLGDLTPFSTIAQDVNKLVEQNNLIQAKTRIKDLEVAWDGAEAGLKPRSADDWHTLDDAIDKALSALRADTPNQADCKVAMTNLLDTFNRLQPTKK